MVERSPIPGTLDIDMKIRAEGRIGAGIKRDNPVRHVDGFIDIVGNQDDGFLHPRPDLQNLILQITACQRIQRAERFVEQQNIGIGRQGSGDIDPLAHAAGQFGGFFVHRRAQINHPDVFFGMRTALFGRPVFKNLIDRQRHIFKYRQPRHQRIVLEHYTTIRPRRGNRQALF